MSDIAWSFKKEVEELLFKAHGHDAYILRRSDDKHSGPYAEIDGEKYVNHLQAITVYRTLKRSAYPGNSGYLLPQDEGLLTDADGIFYMDASVLPKTSDLIIEDTPHERSKREVYKVKRAIPYYISNVLIYFACSCERMDPV